MSIRPYTFYVLLGVFVSYVVKNHYFYRELKMSNMKKVHIGGYSISIPDNYVHCVKVSRVKGSQDVRIRLPKGEHAAATSSAFAKYPCRESNPH